MKKILFVDDEQEILDGLRNTLRKYRREWEVEFANGAEIALAMLQDRTFNIIVSDMQMPNMDGATLLAKVKKAYPMMARVILSGYSNPDAMAKAFPLAHQVLGKPCDVKLLHSTITRIFAWQEHIQDPQLQAVVGKIDLLPSPSQTYLELRQEMQTPGADLKKIAKIISHDPSLCSRLLKIVQSPFFLGGNPITNIEQATSYLGLDTIRALLINTEAYRLLETMEPTSSFSFCHFQSHSLRVASMAKKMMTIPSHKEEAFIGGMLHDIGKIILALFYSEAYNRIYNTAHSSGPPTHRVTHQLEKQMLGFTHADVGACLLGLWNLPLAIVNIVAYHHDPALGGPEFGTLGAVHVANALVGAVQTHQPDPYLTVDLPYLEKIGLQSSLPEWLELARHEVEGV